MELNDITTLMREGIFMVLKLCAPILGSALIIGLIIAIFQATTSIQESTLTFLPKLVTIFLVLAFLGGFLFSILATYTVNLFSAISSM